MTTPAWLPSPSLLVWVIYTSLLLGNAMGLVNESKDAVDTRQDIHSTRAAWTESLKPSSALPTHVPTHVTSPLRKTMCVSAILFWGLMLSAEAHHRRSSITTGMLNNTYGCGNKSVACSLYCGFCDENARGMDRGQCYEILHHHFCYDVFITTIEGFNSTALCKRDVVLKPYNNFSSCSEEIADCLLIPWPNHMVEEAFVGIHTKYFQDCPLQELRDPPPSIVFALVMTPICLIPAMVFLVVLKTKNGDGRS